MIIILKREKMKMTQDLDERKEKKRLNDRIRAKEKYQKWKALPPEQRTPSYYEQNKEARKAYARQYYQQHRDTIIENQKRYNEQKRRTKSV